MILCLSEIPDEERRDEEEFWSLFEKKRSRIFGALLDAVSAAIRNLPATKLKGAPRMADAAKFVTAAEPALGWEVGSFVVAYRRNREAANDLALEASPVAKAVRKLADYGEWKGTAEELRERLGDVVTEEVKKRRSWPGNGLSLSNKLRRLAPSLRRASVRIEFYRENGSSRDRLISIQRLPREGDGRDARDAGKPALSGNREGRLFRELDGLLGEDS